MNTKYRFIHFEEGRGSPKKGVYAVEGTWYCFNTKSGDVLGVVEWYKPWRRWTFWPSNSDVLFSDDYLDNISHFMKQLPKKT